MAGKPLPMSYSLREYPTVLPRLKNCASELGTSSALSILVSVSPISSGCAYACACACVSADEPRAWHMGGKSLVTQVGPSLASFVLMLNVWKAAAGCLLPGHFTAGELENPLVDFKRKSVRISVRITLKVSSLEKTTALIKRDTFMQEVHVFLKPYFSFSFFFP